MTALNNHIGEMYIAYVCVGETVFSYCTKLKPISFEFRLCSHHSFFLIIIWAERECLCIFFHDLCTIAIIGIYTEKGNKIIAHYAILLSKEMCHWMTNCIAQI